MRLTQRQMTQRFSFFFFVDQKVKLGFHVAQIKKDHTDFDKWEKNVERRRAKIYDGGGLHHHQPHQAICSSDITVSQSALMTEVSLYPRN